MSMSAVSQTGSPVLASQLITVEVFANNRPQPARRRNESRPELGYEVFLRPMTPFAIAVTNHTDTDAFVMLAAKYEYDRSQRDWFVQWAVKPGKQVVFDEWRSEFNFLAGYKYGTYATDFEITAHPSDSARHQYRFAYPLHVDIVTDRDLER